MALRIPASSIRHRKEFNSAIRNVDETLENWYNRLKALAQPCEYGSHSEAFILHQFICGLDVLILEHLHAEEKDLSLIDVFDLTKNFERSSEPVDVKPVLLNIKVEDVPSSDGEQYIADNTFSDSDGEEEPTNVAKSEENDDAKQNHILAIMPFMAETVIEQQPVPQVPKLFECYLCHKTWKTAGGLTYHFTCYHTIGRTPKCHLCGKWIKDVSNMVRHLNMHFNMKQFRCHICDFSFARSATLKTHLLSHNKPNTTMYNCTKCPKAFISKKHLKVHRKTHNEPTVSLSEKLDEIARKQKSEKAKAKKTASSETTFKCDICSTAFEKDIALNNHMKVHCETEWLCHLCGKKLMNKRNLIHHYRVHSNEKPFSCNECGRTFSSKEKWKLHSKSHSGIRPHVCTHCDKSFIQKGHLRKHMKVHFPDTKFKCSHCVREFTKEDKLERHILTHSGLNPLHCNYCEKTFKSNSHRTEHERVNTGEKPYKCTLCDKSFGQRATLRGHLRWHEKPKVPKEDRPKKKRKPKIDATIPYSLVQATAAYLG